MCVCVCTFIYIYIHINKPKKPNATQEAYIPSKEPHILTKEKALLSISQLKSLHDITHQKSPIFYQKSLTFHQKSPKF